MTGRLVLSTAQVVSVAQCLIFVNIGQSREIEAEHTAILCNQRRSVLKLKSERAQDGGRGEAILLLGVDAIAISPSFISCRKAIS